MCKTGPNNYQPDCKILPLIELEHNNLYICEGNETKSNQFNSAAAKNKLEEKEMILNIKNILSVMRLGIIAGVSAQGIANSFFTVGEGQEAIIHNSFLGYKDKVYSKGTHLFCPWIESPVKYDLWTQTRQIDCVIGTSELHKVKVGMQVLMHPRDDLRTVLRALGENFEGLVNVQTKLALIRVAALKYSWDQLISEKEDISRKIQQSLTAKVAQSGMVIDKVSLYNITDGKDIDDIEVFVAGTNGAASSGDPQHF